MSVFPKNKLKLRVFCPQNTFPPSFGPYDMRLYPQNSAAFSNLFPICTADSEIPKVFTVLCWEIPILKWCVADKVVIQNRSLLSKTEPLVGAPFTPSHDTHICRQLWCMPHNRRVLIMSPAQDHVITLSLPSGFLFPLPFYYQIQNKTSFQATHFKWDLVFIAF